MPDCYQILAGLLPQLIVSQFSTIVAQILNMSRDPLKLDLLEHGLQILARRIWHQIEVCFREAVYSHKL